MYPGLQNKIDPGLQKNMYPGLQKKSIKYIKTKKMFLEQQLWLWKLLHVVQRYLNTFYLYNVIYIYIQWDFKKNVISVVFFMTNFFHEIFIFGIFQVFRNTVFYLFVTRMVPQKNPETFSPSKLKVKKNKSVIIDNCYSILKFH